MGGVGECHQTGIEVHRDVDAERITTTKQKATIAIMSTVTLTLRR